VRPRIFLSSTIQDLSHIRDALRATIEDIGHEPVMSEHGEVGYLPDQTAEESCYSSLEQCDVLVAVIGRRYGSIGRDSKSVTQNEVRRARDLGIPVYCFIDRDAATELRALDRNPGSTLSTFDNALALSDFVQEVITADRSNSIIPFSSLADAQDRLRKQLAHLFGSLLRAKNNTVQKSLAELIKEVREVRYNLPPEKTEASSALLAAVRFFVDDMEPHGPGPRWHYRRLVVSTKGSIASSVFPLVQAPSFQAFLEQAGVKLELMTLEQRQTRQQPGPHTGQVLAQSNGPLLGNGSAQDLHYLLHPNLELWIDERVLRGLEAVHFDFKRMYTEIVSSAVNASKSSGQ